MKALKAHCEGKLTISQTTTQGYKYNEECMIQ